MWTQANEILNQAAARVSSRMAEFLPGLVAMAVIVLFTFIIAWIVRLMLRRSLASMKFDRRVEQWGFSGVGEWSPASSPSLLMSRLAFWLLMLIGLLIGLSALNGHMIELLVMRLFAYLPNAIAALLIVIAGVLIGRFVARGVLISAVNMQIHSARLVSLGVKWLLIVLAGAMALEHLGIGGQIVSIAFAILFGGIVLTLALAVGLGSKDIISRSIERQVTKAQEEEALQDLHHL